MSLRGLLEKHGVKDLEFLDALGLADSPLVTRDQPRIGIGVTTRNRWDVVEKTLAEITRLTPGAYIVLVDDASDKPGPYVTNGNLYVHRFTRNVGIARAKNKCLELLDDCEHIFLFDDDAYPLVEEWWRPYVESPEPHLMYVFQEFAGRNAPKLNDCRVVGVSPGHVGYSTPRGVMLYVERRVLDIAGGMDEAFGLWGYEHGDWSNRIYSFGLTTWRYGDVEDSSGLIYSLDEHVHEIGGHERSVSKTARREILPINKARHDDQYNSALYRPYREGRDVVLTPFITSVPDPQRTGMFSADTAAIQPLLRSLKDIDVVVMANEITEVPGATVYPAVGFGEKPNPYFLRWHLFYDYLRKHPEVRRVWCVDATDVILLREPFEIIEPGKIYTGSEPSVLSNEWMVANHPEYQQFISDNADSPLLNAGILGGSREQVMAFCHAMMREYHGYLGAGKAMKFDMAAFNFVAREFDVVTGPRIHTVFKAMDHRNEHAIWAHK